MNPATHSSARSNTQSEPVLTKSKIAALVDALAGKTLVVCFGSGVDSTAMLVALHVAGITPSLILFADTGGEKPETIAHVQRMNAVLRQWGWPLIETVRHVPKESTPYTDLYGNCMANETLPSLAFGMKSCSIKWKQGPQDQYLKGVKLGPNKRDPHPLWAKTQAAGHRITKLIGYDCGKADIRRSRAPRPAVCDFDYLYPLQLLRWTREDCVSAITKALGADMVPVKSACFFCPASKHWELYWLAGEHPELLEDALVMERNALTGRHSRFDEVEFGASWESLVSNSDRFPSTTTTVGLGRSFAWNQWARVNNVVDENFKVRREDRERFLLLSNTMRGSDNALDARSTAAGVKQTELFTADESETV